MFYIRTVRVYGNQNTDEVKNGLQIFDKKPFESFDLNITLKCEENVNLDDYTTNLGNDWKRIERISDVEIEQDGGKINLIINNEDNQTIDGFLVFVKIPITNVDYINDGYSKFQISTSKKSFHNNLVNHLVAILSEGEWIRISGKEIIVKNGEFIVRNIA